jgi:hypothetical protein
MYLKGFFSFIIMFFILSNANSQIDSNKEIETDIFNYQPDIEKENEQISFESTYSLERKGEIITLFGTLEEIAKNLPKYDIIKKKKKRGMSDYKRKDKDLLVKKYWNGQDVSINKITTALELGRIETNTRNIRIECRDHSYVDGDQVRLYVNDVIIRSSIVLRAGYYAIDIELEEGFNRIDIKALNQGTSGPNTAEFNVFDETGNLLASKEWNILTGYVATLVVMKN